MSEITTQESIEAENYYLDFFDRNVKYKDRISSLIKNSKIRLIVDINDLRKDKVNRVKKLMNHSFVEISSIQKVVKRCIANIDPNYAKVREEFYVGFEGSFGLRQLNPRIISSEHLGNMVCIEGIITKVSSVKQKVAHSVHYCPATNKLLDRHYSDITNQAPIASFGAYPTKDEEGNVLETEYGLSFYKDYQTILVQEMPETTPAGSMPRAVDVILVNDLVDSCKSGDRVYVAGQYRCLANKRNGVSSGMFRSVLIANNLCSISKQEATLVEDKDFQTIRKQARRQDIIEILTRSIAPSLYGHEFIKRAVLYQLLGGVERELPNGTHIRGDINILLLGDPSVAKSQFLRYVLQIARDRAVATTGRGSSGVGLTAAVTSDKETGEKSLEAGAMVLADRGIICIDEFDKMSDIDRTAIHEVMEQGRVSIAKAGIQAKLNARCSVLAAANPVYGYYNQYKTPMENIGLQDSLLSRFDLLFIILDQCDEESDRRIANFIKHMHLYRAPGEEDGTPLPLQLDTRVDYISTGTGDGEGDKPQHASTALSDAIFEEMFDFNEPVANRRNNGNKKVFTSKFLQKYIQVARQLRPKLTKEACSVLGSKYSDLRAQELEMLNNDDGTNKYRTQPVTVRTLETLIRLATAHAKAKLRKEVTVGDAEAAADLVSYVMFKEVLKKKRTRQTAGSDAESEDVIDDIELVPSKKRKESGSHQEPGPSASSLDTPTPMDTSEAQPTTSGGNRNVTLNAAQQDKITRLMRQSFDEKHETSMSIRQLISMVCAKDVSVSEGLIRCCLEKLHEENLLMVTEEDVYML